MSLFPKRAVYRTRLPRKKLMRKLDGELIEYRPTVNILSTGKFMREHKNESLYYGRHSADRFELFFHRAKTRDGGSTGFYGRVEDEGSGCVIRGVYRKPLYAYFAAVIWLIAFLMCAVGAGAAGAVKGAFIILGVGAAGLFFILFDRNRKYVRAWLEELPEVKNDP